MVWPHVIYETTSGKHRPLWQAMLEVKLHALAAGDKGIDCFDLHWTSSMMTMLKAVQQMINTPKRGKSALAIDGRQRGSLHGPVFHVSVHHGSTYAEDVNEDGGQNV